MNHYRICCHCMTIFEQDTPLPPGHKLCPACKGNATTGINAETIEEALAKRKASLPGRKYKIWKTDPA